MGIYRFCETVTSTYPLGHGSHLRIVQQNQIATPSLPSVPLRLCVSKKSHRTSVFRCAVVWKHGGTEFTEQTAYHPVPFHRLATSGYEDAE
jgi:hypothetical protein